MHWEQMKTNILLLITILLSNSVRAFANCDSAAANLSGRNGALALAQERKLCSHAVDLGPIWCFRNSPVSASDDDAIDSCIYATETRYKVNLSCFNNSPVAISDLSAFNLCFGASNPEPAYCAGDFVNRFRDLPFKTIPRTKQNDAIVALCKDSPNREKSKATMELFNMLLSRHLTINELIETILKFR